MIRKQHLQWHISISLASPFSIYISYPLSYTQTVLSLNDLIKLSGFFGIAILITRLLYRTFCVIFASHPQEVETQIIILFIQY